MFARQRRTSPTHLHEVNPLRSNELLGQLPVDGVDHAGVGDAEAAEELIGLEDLHVSWYEVAQVLPDQVELVHVRLAGPERLSLDQFDEDAADGPHVHLRAVLGVAYQQFGGAVPAGGNVVREVLARTLMGNATS